MTEKEKFNENVNNINYKCNGCKTEYQILIKEYPVKQYDGMHDGDIAPKYEPTYNTFYCVGCGSKNAISGEIKAIFINKLNLINVMNLDRLL